MRVLLLMFVLACGSHDKDPSATKTTGSAKDTAKDKKDVAGEAPEAPEPPIAPSVDHPVTLRLTPTSVELKAKGGSHVFKLETTPTPELVKPILDEIFAEGGKAGVTIWGRYDAPDVWNALAPSLTDVPTTICLRDGSNC